MRYFAIIALFVSATNALGGVSRMHPIQDAEPERITMFREFKSLVEAETNEEYTEVFEPISYSQQVVAGMNFSIIYDIGNGRRLKVDAFQPLAYTNQPAWIEFAGEIPNDEGSSEFIQN